MENQVIRDPAIKNMDSYRVIFDGKLCVPNFNSKGAAEAYLDLLKNGYRKPEYLEPIKLKTVHIPIRYAGDAY